MVKSAANAIYGNFFSRRVVETLDSWVLNPEQTKGLPLEVKNVVGKDILEQQRNIEKTGERNFIYDFSFSVSYFPYHNCTLALIFTEQPALKNTWDFMGPSDFSYWNNTDRPEGFPENTWDFRLKAWDAVLGHDTPAERGFSQIFVPKIYNPIVPNWYILSHQPSHEERVRAYARKQLLTLRMGENPKGFSEVISQVTSFNEWLQTFEGSKALQDKMVSIAEKLVPLYTEEHLSFDYSTPVN
jgi:hypothetical protein